MEHMLGKAKENLWLHFERALKPNLPGQGSKKPTTRLRKNFVSKHTTSSKANRAVLKKKGTAFSPSPPPRRGTFGKLPKSTCDNIFGGAENIEKNNSPHHHFLGRNVKKLFNDEETGKPRLFSGIVTAYNSKRDFYKISYEDGDEEEATRSELENILVSTKQKNGTNKKKRVSKTHSVLENV